jgi:4-nitrophenyl phosphatase
MDLDGTVYYGTDEVPGAVDFIRKCLDKGIRILYVTNRANRTPVEIRDQLRSFRVPCETDDILTSAQATARYLKKGSAWYIGEEGMRLALEEEDIRITDVNPDYVIVSIDKEFNYAKLKKACSLIFKGAKFVATNPDRGLKMEDGISPGTGAIVAAVETGSMTKPLMIGKPEGIIFEMALKKLGMKNDEVIVVGDNIDTDAAAGINAGIRTVVILTGISTHEEVLRSPHKATWTVRNFAELSALFDKI